MGNSIWFMCGYIWYINSREKKAGEKDHKTSQKLRYLKVLTNKHIQISREEANTAFRCVSSGKGLAVIMTFRCVGPVEGTAFLMTPLSTLSNLWHSLGSTRKLPEQIKDPSPTASHPSSPTSQWEERNKYQRLPEHHPAWWALQHSSHQQNQRSEQMDTHKIKQLFCSLGENRHRAQPTSGTEPGGQHSSSSHPPATGMWLHWWEERSWERAPGLGSSSCSLCAFFFSCKIWG